MTLQQASPRLVCTCFFLATLIAAIEPAHIHEARQGPITTAPGPVSVRTSTSTKPTTTMSPTSSSKPSMSPSTSNSPIPLAPSSSSGTLASPGTSSASPQPSSSPGSLYFTVQNLTTCTSALISWNYTGKEAAGLSLSITNIDVPQYKGTVSATVRQQLGNTNTSAQPWMWNAVNVAQGWYEIEGLVLSKPTVSYDSSPFFIANGTDLSCLTATSPQASSTASSSASSSPSSIGSKPNVAGIVGGVVGGIAGLILLTVIAMVCLSRRRKRSFLGRGGRRDRQWGSLKSNTSSVQAGGGDSGAQFAGNHFHGHSESMGAMLPDGAGGSRRTSATTSPGNSEEHVTVVNEEEKLGSLAPHSGMSPFDALNTPLHYDRRTSTYSTQIPTIVAIENFRTRVPSTKTSSQTLEQQAQRIRSSMETTNQRRSERLSMPSLPTPALAHSPTRAQPNEEYPLTPVTPAPVNRSISAGAVCMTVRRTSRKPVPQYDSSLLEDKSADSLSMHTAGAESSQSHGTGAHGTPSGLVHKASFGDGRPLHYLIPDLPSPQLD